MLACAKHRNAAEGQGRNVNRGLADKIYAINAHRTELAADSEEYDNNAKHLAFMMINNNIRNSFASLAIP